MTPGYAEEEDGISSLMHAPWMGRQVVINPQGEVLCEFADN